MFKKIINNIILITSSILFISLIFYFFGFLYFKFIRGYNEIEVIKYNDEINFIKKYSERLHHIRHYNQKYYTKKRTIRAHHDVSDLLFSVESSGEFEDKRSILFLGDSWFEQLLTYDKSRNYINDFFNKNKIKYINAGISLYSPILIKIQQEILYEEFNINPDYIVVYIDQTDFGDEICRYKKNKYTYFSKDNKNNQKLVGVRPDLIKISKSLELSKISLSDNFEIIKDIQRFNFFLTLQIKIVTNNILKILNKDRRVFGCSLNEIFSYLIDPSETDLNYFSKSLKELFQSMKDIDKLKKIFIVTFPHRNQIENVENFENTNDYIINVSNIVDDLLIKDPNNKFAHINFTKLIKTKKISLSVNDFIEKDQASHLTENAHLNIFTKNILKELYKINN